MSFVIVGNFQEIPNRIFIQSIGVNYSQSVDRTLVSVNSRSQFFFLFYVIFLIFEHRPKEGFGMYNYWNQEVLMKKKNEEMTLLSRRGVS